MPVENYHYIFKSSKQYKSALRMNGLSDQGVIKVTKDHKLFHIN